MCYTVPIASAVATTMAWRKTKNQNLWWLNLMLYGGGIFGFVDHLWNGELFFISDKLGRDLLLGAVITATIVISWAGLIFLSRSKVSLPQNQFGKV